MHVCFPSISVTLYWHFTLIKFWGENLIQASMLKGDKVAFSLKSRLTIASYNNVNLKLRYSKSCGESSKN